MLRRPSRSLVALAIVCLALLAPLAASAAVNITGRVMNADGTRPLAGIQVRVLRATTATGVFSSPAAGGLRTTAADGSYSLGLTGGWYHKIQFIDPNGVYITEWYNDKPTEALADAVLLPDTGLVLSDTRLASSAAISGTVRSGAGAGLGNVDVYAFKTGTYDVPFASTLTSVNGTYTLGGLPAGTYVLKFYSGFYAFDHFRSTEITSGVTAPERATPIVLADGERIAGVDETMLAWGSAEGLVGSPTGPVANTEVRFFRYEGTAWIDQTRAMAMAGTDGRYQTAILYPGRYKVRFSGYPYPQQYERGSLTLASGREFLVSENTTLTIDTWLTDSPAVDSTAPTSTLTGIPDDWAREVTGTIEATDGPAGSGVASIRYRVGNGPEAVYAGPFPVTTEGSQTLSYWAVDFAGNSEVTKTATVRVDSSPPTTTAGGVDTAWHTATVTVTFSAADVLSGVRETWYTLGGSDAATTPLTFEVGEGQTPVSFWSVDIVGNTETAYTGTVNVDVTPPTVSSSATSAPYANSAVISVTATDAVSGPASIDYRVNGGLPTTSSNPATITLGPGSYTFDYGAYDAAGNWSGWSASTTITVLGPPATPGALALSSPTPGPKAHLSWSDVASETAYVIERSQDSTSSAAFSAIATLPANATSFDDTGADWVSTWYYRLRAYNPAGYSDYGGPVGIRLDTVAPVTTLDATTAPYADAAAITVSATDTVSGIEGIDFEENGSVTATSANPAVIRLGPGSYDVRVRATDRAGNTSDWSETVRVTVTGPPAAPTGLALARVAPGSTAHLSWNDVATNEYGYVVERAKDTTLTASFSAITTTSAGATSFDDTGADWVSTWYYRVRAYNVAGYSGYAGPVGIRLDSSPPTTTGTGIDTAWHTTTVTVTLTATDTRSRHRSPSRWARAARRCRTGRSTMRATSRRRGAGR
jgi:hypothetical protein